MTEQKTKLKIAIQMFGYLRTFDYCAPSLRRHLLSKYDCDIFMHTWDKLNYPQSPDRRLYVKNENEAIRNYEKLGAVATNEQEVCKAYPELKKLKIEKQKQKDFGIARFSRDYKKHEEYSKISIFGVWSMFYTMIQANKLREEYARKNNVKYDFVIYIRPDILLKNDFDIESFIGTESPQDIDNRFFVCANTFIKVISGFKAYAANDLLFFARPDVMHNVFTQFPNITDIYKPDNFYEHSPEYIMIEHTQNLGHIVYKLDFKYLDDLEIMRLPPPANSLRKFAKQTDKITNKKKPILISSVCGGVAASV